MLILERTGSEATVVISVLDKLEGFELVPVIARDTLIRRLRLLRRDALSMNAARRLAMESSAGVHRLNDEAILNGINELVQCGALHLLSKRPVLLEASGAPANNEEVAPRPKPTFKSSPAPVQDPAMFAESSDDAAQAATLVDASSYGAPFCEECARAAGSGR